MSISHDVLQEARRDMRNAMRIKAACRVAIVALITSVIWFWWLV